MSSCRDAPFVPGCLLFEDMFDYDLTLVKCEKAATPGSFRLYFMSKTMKTHVISKDQQRSLFKNFNESRLLHKVKKKVKLSKINKKF